MPDKKTILLVEDEALVAIAQKKTLERHGYEVIAVHSGEKAIEKVHTTPRIDLILMDINLEKGKMDGTEAAEIILKDRDIPILFLSSYNQPEIGERTERVNSYGYVAKDSGETVLTASIKMAFKLHGAYKTVKKQEESLQETLARYALLFEGSSGGVWDWDVRNRRVHFSPGWKSMRGYTDDEIDDREENWSEGIHPDDAGRVMAALQEYFEQKTDVFKEEYRVRRKDGSYMWILDRGKAIRGTDGQVVRMAGSEIEITERKQAEEELRRIQYNLAEAQKIAHLGSFEYDVATRQTIWSDEEYRIYGLEPAGPSPVYDSMLAQCIHPDDAALLHETFTCAIQNLSVYELEHRIVRPDGTVRWVYDLAHPYFDADGNLVRYIGTTLDITDRKLAEEALRKSEKQLREIYSISHIGTWTWDYGTDTVVWNEELYRIAGLDPMLPAPTYAEHTGIFTEESWGLLNKSVERAMEAGTPYQLELELIRPDGSRRIINAFGGVTYDMNGRINGLHGTIQDITDLKRAEKALRESEERLRLSQKATNDVVWDWDIVGDTQRWNEAGAAVFGWMEIVEGPVNAHWWVERVHPEDRSRVDEKFFAVVNDPRADRWNDEYRFLKADGSYAEVMDRGYVLRDVQGKAVRMIGAMLDITDRKRAEGVLRESKLQLEVVINASNTGLWDWDLKTNKVYYSPEWKRQIGYEEWEISNDFSEWESRVHPDDLERAQSKVRTFLENPYPDFENEFRFRHKDGSYRWILARASVLTDEKGNPLRMLGSHLDITDRKRADDALRENEAQLRSILRAAPVGIGTVVDRVISQTNDMLCAMTGYSQDELQGQNARLLYPTQDDFEFVGREKYAQIADYGTGTVETRWLRKDGTIIDVLLSSTPLDLKDLRKGVTFTALDITERKRAEDALRQSEERYRNLYETLRDAFVQVDMDGRIIDFNDAYVEMLGYSHDEIRVLTHQELTPEKWHAAEEAIVREQIIARGYSDVYQKEYRRKDGTLFPIEIRTILVRDTDGRPASMWGIVRDITDRKRTEENLQRERDLLGTIMNAPRNVHLAYLDRDFNFVRVNEAYAATCGYRPDEMIGKNHFVLYPHPENEAIFARVRDTGEPFETRDKPFEFPDQPVRGVTYWDWTLTPETNSSGEITGLIFALVETTDRRHMEQELRTSHEELERRVQERTAELEVAYEDKLRMEEELRQAHKMEAIGTLAGGIAHDFNNILAAILGFTEMAIDDAGEGRSVEKSLQNIHVSSLRARDLVKQILTFSRKTGYERTPIPLSPIVRETVQLLRASIPATVDIKLSVTATSDKVLAAPTEVQQILMNLATNASLAMAEAGGTLEIILSDIDFMPRLSEAVTDLMLGEYVQLIVRDTGTGMGPDVMRRVFEPFFTTRELGRGTGMGLAVVYGIVTDLEGTITVESEPGIGSTFRVFLPKIQTKTEKDGMQRADIPAGTENILFVDDEDMIVDWAKAALEKLGYRVAALTDPAEALKIFASDPSRFDLVITDQAMPPMSGMQLARKLLIIRPDIPIIISTGHSAAVSPETVKKAGIKQYLMKPLTKDELARAVRRALDTRMEDR